MSKYKVLIIEDEENINNLLSVLLETNGYRAISARTCSEGVMLFSSHRPDLVILDLGLPDADGVNFIKTVRRDDVTPIIMLSARCDEGEKVQALDLGANDYITKPFGADELMARVRSALRNVRIVTSVGSRFEAKGLVIDYDSRRVFINGGEISLTHTEYNIMAFLSENCGKVMTYSAIIKKIWGYSDINSTKKLQVNMANIRKKLGAKPGGNNYIINELGVGYRMCDRD